MHADEARTLLTRYEDIGVLTYRQRSILRLIAHGLTVDQVAAELGIAAGTVRAHLATVKLNVAVYETRMANRKG